VSTVVGCPYEGKVDVEKVVLVSKALHEMGCYEISLGDTIGVGRPNEFRKLIESLTPHIPIEKVISEADGQHQLAHLKISHLHKIYIVGCSLS
jgi:isopropylmalate/homocitrate/citramalate synthase